VFAGQPRTISSSARRFSHGSVRMSLPFMNSTSKHTKVSAGDSAPGTCSPPEVITDCTPPQPFAAISSPSSTVSAGKVSASACST
jgi:hypothetical protein